MQAAFAKLIGAVALVASLAFLRDAVGPEHWGPLYGYWRAVLSLLLYFVAVPILILSGIDLGHELRRPSSGAEHEGHDRSSTPDWMRAASPDREASGAFRLLSRLLIAPQLLLGVASLGLGAALLIATVHRAHEEEWNGGTCVAMAIALAFICFGMNYVSRAIRRSPH